MIKLRTVATTAAFYWSDEESGLPLVFNDHYVWSRWQDFETDYLIAHPWLNPWSKDKYARLLEDFRTLYNKSIKKGDNT